MSPKRRIHLLTMSKILSHPVVVDVVVKIDAVAVVLAAVVVVDVLGAVVVVASVVVVVVVVVVAAQIFSSRKCSSHFLE